MRPDTNVSSAIEVVSDVETTYHGFVLQANKRFSDGLLFNMNYTLSKARDTGQNSTTFIAGTSCRCSILPTSRPRKGLRTPTVVIASSPAGTMHPTISGACSWVACSPAESGLPIDATIATGSVTGTGAMITRASNGAGGSFRAPFEERNGYRQDGRKTVDFRLSKEFNVGGRKRIVALAEAFNLFNWTNFTSFSTIKYRGIGNAVYNPATNVVTMNSDRGCQLPTAVRGQQHAVRTARRAARAQVPLVTQRI